MSVATITRIDAGTGKIDWLARAAKSVDQDNVRRLFVVPPRRL